MMKDYTLFLHEFISQACSNDKGLVIIWIDPEKEPTRHIFNDLPFLKANLIPGEENFLF